MGGTVAIWALAALLGVLAVVRLAGSSDGGGAASEPVRIERSPPLRSEASLYVHVAGAVRRPGLVEVAPGSRVAAAIARAGGPAPRADLAGVNLAARLDDGQQVVVPAAASAAPGAAAAPAVKPSLGSATIDQLDEIDGIGPTLAERIVEYRTENGGFASLDELQEVEGIGEQRLETLREALQP